MGRRRNDRMEGGKVRGRLAPIDKNNKLAPMIPTRTTRIRTIQTTTTATTRTIIIIIIYPMH